MDLDERKNYIGNLMLKDNFFGIGNLYLDNNFLRNFELLYILSC